jgi:hypothetical protein
MRAFLTQVTAVIANGQTVSGAVNLADRLPVALQMPAAFTGASVSFQGSFDGTTFQAVFVGGAAYSELVAASENVVLDSSMFLGFRQIKVVSASAEGAARSVVVLLRTDG